MRTIQSTHGAVSDPVAIRALLTDELGIPPIEVDAIQRQGFVASEQRGNKTLVYKLRFRIDGRQRVCYLGTDAGYAARVSAALRALQQQRTFEWRMGARAAELRSILRTIKPRLAPHAAASGLQFHGRRLRRPHGNHPPRYCSDFQNEPHNRTLFKEEIRMIDALDRTPPAVPDATSEPTGEALDALQKRHKRILQYIDEVDAKVSALEANIGLINADLMSLLVYYRQDLDQLRAVIKDPKERLQWLHPITEQIYKICKQIDSFIQTNMRLERERRRHTARRARRLENVDRSEPVSPGVEAAESADNKSTEHDSDKSEEIES
jgi:hypothetical protein